MIKNLPTNAGDIGDAGSIPGSGRSLGEGNGNPLQYFCLGNPMDRGAWRVTVYGVPKVVKDRVAWHAAVHLVTKTWAQLIS